MRQQMRMRYNKEHIVRRLFQPSPALHPVTPDTPRIPAEPVGSLIAGRYRVEAYLAGGGFAHIYGVRDLKLGTLRAIKEATYHDSVSRQQFEEEADMLINLSHPHIVRGYSLLTSGQKQYLVMDYIDGPTVEDVVIDYIKVWRRAPETSVALNWILPICNAVRALHSQPLAIIHRDIKPANIQIERDTGRPVLIDLGLAKYFAPGRRTFAAALAFTPGYAPPEQYQASGSTDQRTDVYALGATLFFLVTGFQPIETPSRLTGVSQPRPSERNPDVDPVLDEIIMRAMALDPRERYQTMAALESDLRAARQRLDQSIGLRTGYASGGPLPTRACAHCGTQNPGIALYCFQCGYSFTSSGAADESRQASAHAVSAFEMAAGSTAPLVALTPAEMAPLTALTDVRLAAPALAQVDLRHDEARMTILTLIAMMSLALGLLSFVTPVMLVATALGIVLAHDLVGFRVLTRPLGWKLAWRAHQLRPFRRIPWNPTDIAPELRTPLRIMLGGGYLVLVTWLALELLTR